jgi:hypothetical protein
MRLMLGYSRAHVKHHNDMLDIKAALTGANLEQYKLDYDKEIGKYYTDNTIKNIIKDIKKGNFN